jgi:hypothetical protein
VGVFAWLPEALLAMLGQFRLQRGRAAKAQAAPWIWKLVRVQLGALFVFQEDHREDSNQVEQCVLMQAAAALQTVGTFASELVRER